MENKRIKETLYSQLAIDYDCTIEDVISSNNIFRLRKVNEGARPIADDPLLKIAVVNEKLLVMSDEKILEVLKDRFNESMAMWLAEPENLIFINDLLKEFGNRIADIHHYYVPTDKKIVFDYGFDTKYYHGEEIKEFEGDNRFSEAVLFDELTPDMMAVAAFKDGVILGLAGATKDTSTMWQIGINVTEEGKGLGVGSYLINSLKEEVEKEGIVPFYCTVESHIKSQKVAINAGFVPVFYELFSE